MTDAGFFRGTSAEQDNRFSDKEKKLLKQMKFGENVSKKVDMSKIKVDVLRPWISKRVEELLGMEDDVIEEFVVNQLEADQYPDGRRIQINLTGFLNGRNARIFTAELWDMLISAQGQSTGIPTSILESKQEEIKKRNEEQEKLTETLKKTVSRFNDKLKNDRDSSPPLPSSRGGPSSPNSRSSGLASIKREKTSEQSRDLDSGTAAINRRKDDGGRRNYRSRRSSSPSSPRHSRSRSRDRDRRDYRRDRSPPRGGGDRRGGGRDRSRSPAARARRSPGGPPSRGSYNRDNRSRSRDRDRDRDSRSTAAISSNNRRYSDYRDRDNYNNNRGSRDLMGDRDRRRSPSREDRDRRGGGARRESDFAQNGSRFRHGSSPNPPSRHTSPPRQEKETRRFAPPPEEDYRGSGRRDTSVEADASRKRQRSPLREPNEENSGGSGGESAPEDSPIAKKSKKEKKNKKDKKKHKKHKKGKKSSRKSRNGAGSPSDSEEDDDDDNSASDNDHDAAEKDRLASSYVKYVDASGGIHQTSEDLERRLREKALESLKKATSSR